MKKVISFDLDGTLVHGKYGDLVWNEGIPTEYAKQYSMPFDTAKAYIRKQYEAVGDGDVTWYNIEVWLEKFGLAVSAADLLNRYESQIELLPGAREVLDKLSERYILVISSNAARIFVEKETSVAGITEYFAHIVSAATDWGVLKKEEAFFQRLLTTLDLASHEVVHVGDHRVFDYEVPSRFGIESYHVSDGQGQHNGDRVIRNLTELLDKLL